MFHASAFSSCSRRFPYRFATRHLFLATLCPNLLCVAALKLLASLLDSPSSHDFAGMLLVSYRLKILASHNALPQCFSQRFTATFLVSIHLKILASRNASPQRFSYHIASRFSHLATPRRNVSHIISHQDSRISQRFAATFLTPLCFKVLASSLCNVS